MRSRAWLLVAIVMMATSMSPMLEHVAAQSASGIVISELRFSGPRGTEDEFVELFNAGTTPVSLRNWLLRISNNSVTGVGLRATLVPRSPATDIVVQPGCYFLIANATAYSLDVTPDYTYSPGFADNGSVAIALPTGAVVDGVGFGATSAFREGTFITPIVDTLEMSWQRVSRTGARNVDTNNNSADFQRLSPPNPQNSEACNAFALPHQVQGNGAVSPVDGLVKTVRGVVTARTRDGVFLQTEVGQQDADPATSEGLFVAVSAALLGSVQVGDVVRVKGTVTEWTPADDSRSPSRTQLDRVTELSVLLSGQPLPGAHELTAADLSAGGALDQLERYEGMLVSAASLTSVSGTDADGVFYAVRTGEARPFREPGVETGYPVLPCVAETPCRIASFDGNPERLRVDSGALRGATHLSSGTVVENVRGPLDFGSRTYTVLAQALTVAGGGTRLEAAPVAPAELYTVASLNAQRFDDVPEAVWLAKASLLVRTVLNLPDVVALQGVDGAALDALAARVNADAGALSPAYAALSHGGTDVGFLVKGRVSGASVTSVGTGDAFSNASLLLQATINGPRTSLPQSVRVLANHLEPVNGVLARRRAQAEALADYVQGLQRNAPDGALVVVGDFNAFGFNDGYVDTLGTVLGAPAPADQVAFASADLVTSDLVNLSSANAYSFVANGNAQTHEHVLVNASLTSQLAGLLRLRVNGDFPHSLRGDETTPSRVSAKDPVVVYFSFPPDVSAPQFGNVSDQAAEATGPDGAVVRFATPEATDNLDDVVVVTCAPSSGSVFPLGNTGVTCSASDAAGNPAATAFTVTVADTVGPVLTVPDDFRVEASSANGQAVQYDATATDAVNGSIVPSCLPASGATFPVGRTRVACMASDARGNMSQDTFDVIVTDSVAPVLMLPADVYDEALSPAGRAVQFAASATDVVSGLVGVSCSYASGSTFPIGTTLVECNAADRAGNAAAGSFTVSIARPVPGRMHGAGSVDAGQDRVTFTFNVGESEDFTQRGALKLLVKGSRRVQTLDGVVDDVSFSNDAAYAPGGSPASGVDTVMFTGHASWNGVAGYRFDVRASDRGEPGVNLDTFQVVVTSPSGQVVLSAFGALRGGNVQSLRSHSTQQAQLVLERLREALVQRAGREPELPHRLVAGSEVRRPGEHAQGLGRERGR